MLVNFHSEAACPGPDALLGASHFILFISGLQEI